jgi:SP family sugar:H+ symporter-like MFS transporter
VSDERSHGQESGTSSREHQPSKGKVLGITIAAALGGLLFGFDTSVINGAVDSIQKTFDLGSAAIGFTVAITLIGCAIGAWFAGQLADAWGRKIVMLIAAVLFVASSIGSGFAFADWELMSWRFIGGLAIGIASVIAPAYIG